jgi:septum formation protein
MLLILASASPQRSAILAQLGIAFEARPAGVSERDRGPAEEVVRENALRKARTVAAAAPGELVMGVDTVVELDGRLYGKAAGPDEARSYLRKLSGRRHTVWSALAILDAGAERLGTARTEVTFRTLGESLLSWYLQGGEWRDRAGAYAIQGKGAALVRRIEGDYWNVVGLPVALMLEMAPELVT